MTTEITNDLSQEGSDLIEMVTGASKKLSENGNQICRLNNQWMIGV